jgi:hypothetical protein
MADTAFYDPTQQQAPATQPASQDDSSFIPPDATAPAPTQQSTSTGNFIDNADDTTQSTDSDSETQGTSPPAPTGPPVSGDTGQPIGDNSPAPMTPPPAPMGTAGYSQWQSQMQAAGYSADQISAMYSQQYNANGTPINGGSRTTGGGFYGGPPYPNDYGTGDPGTGYVGQGGLAGEGTPDDPGVVGEDLGDWQPGDVYTGTGNTSGDFLMTDTTFTPDNSSVDAAADTQPVNWDVTADQTVQGQMDQIVGHMQENPVYQSLAASLERAQASHGGENSLMAETAAYNGVVNLAFQVASADAATYARSAEFNASTANQFALSNRQFMQQALLSTQNYQQSQVLQSQQIQGNLQSVSMQIAGQIRATSIGANAQVASAQIGAAAQRAAASISAGAALASANIQRQTAMDSINANFQAQWTLNEQGQAHGLEMSDRTTDNSIRHDTVVSNQQFGQQLTLQMNTESNANLRQLMGTVGQIGATPGLTGDQQANAIRTVTDIYHTNASLTNSFYTTPAYSLGSGQAGANVTSGSNGASTNTGPGGPTYQQYGDYLSYGQGGYTMVAPPVLPYEGGSGLPTSQGGIAMYGSNTDFENATGNTVDYNNQLTNNNPIGNSPGQSTGGANYSGGNDFIPSRGGP